MRRSRRRVLFEEDGGSLADESSVREDPAEVPWPRKHVSKRWWAVLAVALLIAITIPQARRLTHYSPLRSTLGVSFTIDGVVVARLPVSADETPRLTVFSRSGSRALYSIVITNVGPWGVSIVGIDLPSRSARVLFRPSETRIAPGLSDDLNASTPFRPFALQAGHRREIFVLGTLSDCRSFRAGFGNVLDSIRIRFRFLGRTQPVRLPLGQQIEILSPPDTACPGRRS